MTVAKDKTLDGVLKRAPLFKELETVSTPAWDRGIES